MKKTKYYVLYKTITDADGNIEDITPPLTQLKNYDEIVKYLHIDRHHIKQMLNNYNDKIKTLKTFKNYTIIIDEDIDIDYL